MNPNPVDHPIERDYECASEAKPMFYVSSDSLPGLNPTRPPFPAIRLGRGVNTLATKPAKFRKGIVSISEGRTPKKGESFWELRYIDPDTTKEVKRRVSGLSRPEIEAMADHLTREAYAGRGYLAGREKAPTIQEGIATALMLSRMNEETQHNMAQRAMCFVGWLKDHFPLVLTWDQMRPAMIKSYLIDCEQGGLAWDTIRLRLAPIKSAWRAMAENHPELVRPLVRIRMADKPRQEIECLNAAEVSRLLGWLENHGPRDLWTMAILQGLCGLRMLEAHHLRREDVDLQKGTITIAKTESHKPKTRDSVRTLPVCREALEALRKRMDGQKVIPITGELFPLVRRARLSSKWSYWLSKAAESTKEPRFKEIPSRKLRAAFATMAGRLGAQDRILKAYLGHVPGDMLGGHYRKIGLDELESVSGLMNGWRKLAESGDLWKHSGNIPAAIAQKA